MGYYYYIGRQVDPTKLYSGKINIYGIYRAKAMACDRFLNTAVEAVRTGRGQGPERYYRNTAKLSGLNKSLRMILRNEDINNESVKNNNNDVLVLRARI